MGGSCWSCFNIKNNESFYFDSFGCRPDKYLSNQLSKPILNHDHKIQVLNSDYADPTVYTSSI